MTVCEGQANLQGGWLADASFKGADLRNTRFQRASLARTNFEDANLEGALGLEQDILSGKGAYPKALISNGTHLPSYLTTNEAAAKFENIKRVVSCVSKDEYHRWSEELKNTALSELQGLFNLPETDLMLNSIKLEEAQIAYLRGKEDIDFNKENCDFFLEFEVPRA